MSDDLNKIHEAKCERCGNQIHFYDCANPNVDKQAEDDLHWKLDREREYSANLLRQLKDRERERDEARESLAGGRYNGMWMVLGCIGAWAHFEREQNRARDFFWKYDIMRSMIEAVEGLESDLAQRDRRIAELEAALRKMIRLGAQDGVELIRLADAALSASAQPATAAKCASCMGTGKKMGFAESTEPCWHCAAPPSPAAPKLQPLIVPDKTEEMVARFGAEVEREYEARRLAGEMCRAIEVTGEKCTATIERGALWCDHHRGVTSAVISSNRTADEQKAMERLERVARMRLNVGVNDVVDSMLVDAVEALDAARSKEGK